MFTSQHYNKIAEVFQKISATNKMFFMLRLADMLEKDNSRFDRPKFMQACIEGGPCK